MHSSSPKDALGNSTVQVANVHHNQGLPLQNIWREHLEELQVIVLRCPGRRDYGFLSCQGMSAHKPTKGLAPLMPVLEVKLYIIIQCFSINNASILEGKRFGIPSGT